MNAEDLLKHYARISEAPDAIPKMRQFVLDLAVRGKLVEQDAADEPASELHRRLASDFKGLQRATGRGKRSEAAGIIAEPPFGLPKLWNWVPMGDLGQTNIGLTYSPSNVGITGIPVLRSNNVQNGSIDLNNLVRVDVTPKESVMVAEGDMLICARNGSRALVGKAAIIEKLPEPMAFGAFMALFRSPINPYLHLFLASPVFRQVIDEVNTTTINQITQSNLRSTLVPLPPLAEQHRIVAKADELMALCDRLEEARTAREGVRDKLTAASLTRLTATETTEQDFQSHARFALQTLPKLTTRPDQIKPLRQTILNLAVQGKLVEQDTADEPAAELLRKIDLKTASTPIASETELPRGWVLARIDELATVGTGVTPSKSESAYHVNGTIPWVNSAATNLPVIDSVDTLVTERAVKECRLKIYPVGSLVVALYGQGKTRGQAAELRIAATVNQACAVIQFKDGFDEIRPFLLLSLKKQYEEMRSLAEGGAQPNLNLGKIKSKILPLPPLAEQHRIVAKVDALMVLCDRLETSLTTADITRQRLLTALLHEALEPAEETADA